MDSQWCAMYSCTNKVVRKHLLVVFVSNLNGKTLGRHTNGWMDANKCIFSLLYRSIKKTDTFSGLSFLINLFNFVSVIDHNPLFSPYLVVVLFKIYI